jgi:arabinose-5-phosphate isomerase
MIKIPPHFHLGVTEEDVRRSFDKFVKHTIDSISSIPYGDGIRAACEAIANCRGKIVTTGIGKAGMVARKSAATFSSLGMPAVYLHPGDSAHGDAGIISTGDILIAFSTSGKTREVCETIRMARQPGLKVDHVISVTSHPDSEIRHISDIVVDMGVVKEAGYLGIAPTTSVIVMLILADMMATIVSESKVFTMEDYGLRHHGGYLGKVARGETNEAK